MVSCCPKSLGISFVLRVGVGAPQVGQKAASTGTGVSQEVQTGLGRAIMALPRSLGQCGPQRHQRQQGQRINADAVVHSSTERPLVLCNRPNAVPRKPPPSPAPRACLRRWVTTWTPRQARSPPLSWPPCPIRPNASARRSPIASPFGSCSGGRRCRWWERPGAIPTRRLNARRVEGSSSG